MSEQQMPARIWITSEKKMWPTFRSFTASDIDHSLELPQYPSYVRADIAERMAVALETHQLWEKRATVRGFTDLERALLIAAKATQNYIANTESELGMTLKSGDLLRAAIAKAEACEISTHPHTGDCDKPIPEGLQKAIDDTRAAMGRELSSLPKLVCPSDRTADVTAENIALVLLDGWKAGKAPIQIARALLDAFTVGKRLSDKQGER